MEKSWQMHIRIYKSRHPDVYDFLIEENAKGVPLSVAVANGIRAGLKSSSYNEMARLVADELERRGMVIAAVADGGDVEAHGDGIDLSTIRGFIK